MMDNIELIKKEVEKSRDEIVKFVQKLVRIKSFSGDKKGLSEIAQVLADEMKKTGISVELLESEEGLTNVIGRYRGSAEAPSILFNGHTDVVPVQSEKEWIVDPFSARIKDGRLYGRGACDMKGGIAAMIAAFKIVMNLFPEYEGNIILTATVNEETGGFEGMKHILEEGIKADMGIVCEPSDFMVTNVCKGLLWAKLRATGKSAHGSMPENGVNAVFKMSKILSALEGHIFNQPPHEMLGSPTISVGKISGGIKPILIPDLCEAEIDVRYLPGHSHLDVIDEIEKKISELKEDDPQIETEIQIMRYRSSIEVSKDETIVKMIMDAMEKVTGKRPLFRGMPSPGDSEYLVKGGVPSVMFGPGSEQLAHVDNEWISISDILTAVAIYAVIMIKCKPGL